MQQPVFFQPAGAWVGDVIPWQEHGEFSLFYLHEVRRSPKPGTPWHLVTTNDFVHFDDEGRALGGGRHRRTRLQRLHGQHRARRRRACTTSSTRARTRAASAPTGCPSSWSCTPRAPTACRPGSGIPSTRSARRPATSPADWRDPFVFRDEEAGLWRMLVAARHVDGPERRRGVIAQCVSRDLVSWEHGRAVLGPAPLHHARVPRGVPTGATGGTSSTPSSRSRSPPDTGWSRSLRRPVAGAAARLARRPRLLRGEVRRARRPPLLLRLDRQPGRQPRRRRRGSGPARSRCSKPARTPTERSRSASPPNSWRASTTTSPSRSSSPSPVARPPPRPPRRSDSPRPTATAPRSRTRMPRAPFHAGVTFDIAPGTTECGVLLRASDDGDEGYVLRLEPKRGRMVFDRWPRRRTGDGQWQVSGDVPFVIELERPCDLPPGEHTLEVVVDGDLCVADLDGRSASAPGSTTARPVGWASSSARVPSS